MRPEEVVHFIEGEPFISKVPVEPGLTNKMVEGDKSGNEIVGINTENSEIHAGYVRFDIIFYVRTKDEISQIIINIEAQKTDPTDYNILNRAIFYISRMISSHIHLTNDTIMGNHKWKGEIELLNIIMIGVAENLSRKDESHELHRLLGALLSEKLKAAEKLDILENEYHIAMEESIEEDVKTMCNLSEGIEERAMERGRKDGINTVLRLAEKCHLSKEETIQQLCEGMKMEVAEAEKYYEEYRKDVQTSL